MRDIKPGDIYRAPDGRRLIGGEHGGGSKAWCIVLACDSWDEKVGKLHKEHWKYHVLSLSIWEGQMMGMPYSCDDKDIMTPDEMASFEYAGTINDPMIHKDFPGGLEDLQEYAMEVCDGIKDHLIRDIEDPTDTRWEYTYHQRLFYYGVPAGTGMQADYNQIETMCQKIAKTPYTRRAQAITWKVWEDNDCDDPACMQSIWCRALENDDGSLTLNMNVRFRSQDAYKAGFMNMFALIMLMQKIANRIQELSGRAVHLGRYCNFSDSYHIYGKDLKEFDERFIGGMTRRDFDERVYNYADVKGIMDEAIPGILEKARNMGR